MEDGSKFMWGSLSTESLIDIWSKPEHQKGLEEWTRNKIVYRAIAEELSELIGVKLTADQCKSKIHNLKDRYKKEVRKIETTGSGKSYWAYFEKMDNVLATKAAYSNNGTRDSLSDGGSMDDTPRGKFDRRSNQNFEDTGEVTSDDDMITVDNLPDTAPVNEGIEESCKNVDGAKTSGQKAKLVNFIEKVTRKPKKNLLSHKIDEMLKIQEDQTNRILDAHKSDMEAFERMEQKRMEKEENSDQMWFGLFSKMFSGGGATSSGNQMGAPGGYPYVPPSYGSTLPYNSQYFQQSYPSNFDQSKSNFGLTHSASTGTLPLATATMGIGIPAGQIAGLPQFTTASSFPGGSRPLSSFTQDRMECSNDQRIDCSSSGTSYGDLGIDVGSVADARLSAQRHLE